MWSLSFSASARIGIVWTARKNVEGSGIMRINVYSQELTNEVHLISKKSNTAIEYHAVQLMLHSSPMLHHPPKDDDRSAITLWLPRSPERRQELALALERMAALIRLAPPETGLD